MNWRQKYVYLLPAKLQIWMGDARKDVQAFEEMIAPNSGKLTIPNVFPNISL